ncbi:MAG: YceI family protein, partial [Rhodobacteraceae bacterium]|nr:YceI family protein [Paracoccaceae bacterium]
QSLPFVPKDVGVADTFAGLHIVFERVLLVSLILHIAGALKHHVIDKDATLRRMWFGASEVSDTKAHGGQVVPAITAVAAWCVAVFIGANLGLYTGHSHAETPTEELAEVQSDWVVQSGTLEIVTRQFGQDVQGSFADWTAAISFDPEVTQGSAGSVDVSVAIGSLILGSVTDQAFGPDYFDATGFPTARFVADISPITDGYVAQGTLEIKGVSIPVELPFGLSLDGDTASMTGALQVDRREFSIGMNMLDEGQLAHNVTINVALTAQRGGESDG